MNEVGQPLYIAFPVEIGHVKEKVSYVIVFISVNVKSTLCPKKKSGDIYMKKKP